jgi:LuxR family maltose regulon positive regulatory protein
LWAFSPTATLNAVVQTQTTLALAEPPGECAEDALLRARSRPPRPRPGRVRRPHLVGQLMKGRRAPVSLLVAPAGYGKTTLLSDWDAQDKRPFAWITLGEDDNHPARLLAHIGCSLDPIEPVGDDVFEALSVMRPVVLVLDDLHVLHEPDALAMVIALAQVLRPGSQLALASRSEPALPLGRLRAHGNVVELHARDLAMDATEADTIFAAAAVDVDDAELRALVARTEGWPAGLYLAALSVSQQADVPEGVARFAGDDRYVADYVRDEFFSGLSEDDLTFLTRTSVLERLSGPLCDAILDARGSAGTLARLARSNLPFLPLDHNDEWYRSNHLLADSLRARLHRREPDRECLLHLRACAWFEDHGETDAAIQHAVAGHDVHRAGSLMWRNLSRHAGRGGNGTIRHRLDRFTDDEIGGCSALALVAANSYLEAGDGNRVDHWTSVAAGGLADSSPAAAEGLEAGVAVMRAGIARHGIGRMAQDAAHAYELEPSGSSWRPFCRLIEGVACHLAGDRVQGRAYLEEGMRGAAVHSPNVHSLCLAQLALLAMEEDDWEGAAWLASRAKALVERSDLGDSAPAALVFAVSAAARAHRGQVEEATGDRRRALKLLARLTDFAPWYDAEARIVLARAGLRLSDPASARGLLAEASRILRQTPDALVLGEWLDQVRAQADATEGSTISGGWSLTTAELRILQFLPSHLSFPQIANRLYVSPNTVKTHVRAVYRKLDASSRGQAVDNARENGLLDLNGGG